MRPDSSSWNNVQSVSSLEFTPRQLSHHKFVRWFTIAMVVQSLTAMSLWLALHAFHTVTASPEGHPYGDWFADFHASLVRAIFSFGTLAAVGSQGLALLLGALIFKTRVRLMISRHVRGLEGLFKAIRDMACGITPKPLAAGGPGEVGYLTLAFNDMAGRIAASRQALLEANQMLERRVEERTRELQEALKQVETMAKTDALTGLLNRRCLGNEMNYLFDEARHADKELACLAIDLDGFKEVNDVLGHQMGDQIIQLAAKVLRKNCRSSDAIARLGGDEFLVTMSQIDQERAVQVAERLRTAFTQEVGALIADSPGCRLPSMSIGVAFRSTGRPQSLSEIMAQADCALYQAKEDGKDRVSVYRPAA